MDELAAVQASSLAELPYMATSGIMLTGETFHGNPLERTGSSDPLSDTSDKSKGMLFIKDRINLNAVDLNWTFHLSFISWDMTSLV